MDRSTAARGVRRALRMLLFAMTMRAAAPVVSVWGATAQERPIVATIGAKDRLVSVQLDEGVYREVGADLRAIRVLDAANREVPFVVRTVTASKTLKAERSALVQQLKATVGDGDSLTIEFTIDAKNYPHPVESFTIDSDLSNFEQRVDVEWSKDGTTWTRVLEGALLYDYHQYLDARETKISMPAGAVSQAGGHFRLVFRKPMQVQESPLVELTRKLEGGAETSRSESLLINRQVFRIERIRFSYQEEQREVGEAVTQEVPVRIEVNRVDAKTGDQEIVLSCAGQPIQQLEFVTQDTNFGRTVWADELTGKKDEKGADIVLSHLGQAVITRIQLEDIQRDEVKMSLPGTRVRLLRLRIDNRNSPPLSISRVAARAGVNELLFLARPGERYRLRYAGDTKAAPAYDTLALDAAVQKGLAAERGTLGTSTLVTRPDTPQVPMRERIRLSSWWFLLLVAALVAVVGYGLYQAMRRVAAMPSTDA